MSASVSKDQESSNLENGELESNISANSRWYEPSGKLGFIATDWFRNATIFSAFVIAIWQLLDQNSQFHASLSEQSRQFESSVEKQTLSQDESNRLTREMNYDRMWTGYMELAIEYPEFADGTEYSRLNSNQRVQYAWFFDRLIYTVETIMLTNPDSDQWIDAFKTEIKKHKSLIESHPPILNEYLCQHDPIVRGFISDASDLARVKAEECIDA